MPRTKRIAPRTQAMPPTTAVMASGHRYTGRAPRIYNPSKDWQIRCYHHYSILGEARYAARYFGRAMSRAKLVLEDKSGKPVTSGSAFDSLNMLFGGPEGQTEMLEMVGVHLTVAGECYMVGRHVNGVDVWEVLSVLEVESNAAGWQIRAADSANMIPLSGNDTVIRVWNPKPDQRWEADSPFRSLLPVLDEIEWLTRYIHAEATSRLAGAGIEWVPDNITFPPPPPTEDGKARETANEADAFMQSLGAYMTEPIGDPSSPDALVPFVVMADAEAIDKIKHQTFWSPLDENVREMRRDAIHRFGIGMDLPVEMIEGMSGSEGTGGGNSNGVSHWGAWMIEEQSIKLHVEPALDRLIAAIWTYYLAPLGETGDGILRYDTSALRLRPDRSQESITLYDHGELKASTMRKENGFSETDAPDDDERLQWLLKKVATGSASPEQVGAALEALGVTLDVPDDLSEETPAPETPQPPSLEDIPDRPRTPEESSIRLYEALVLRALERAGNRLRNITQMKTPGPSFEAHTHLVANGSSTECLQDAWSTADLVLDDDGGLDRTIRSLNDYCTFLMEHQKPHTREELTNWCEKAGIS